MFQIWAASSQAVITVSVSSKWVGGRGGGGAGGAGGTAHVRDGLARAGQF